MRSLVVVGMLCATSVAYADPTELGGISLGQKMKKAKPKAANVFGCDGTLFTTVAKGKVTKVAFMIDPDASCMTGDDVTPGVPTPALLAAISSAAGVSPVDNDYGAVRWDGASAAFVLVPTGGGDMPVLEVDLVKTTAHPVCWAGDGFADFWSGFVAAAASGDGAQIAPYFKLPWKADGVRIKNAKAFARRWGEVFSPEDVDALKGDAKPWCDAARGVYTLLLESTHELLVATQVKGAWKFSRLEIQPQD